MLRVSKCKPFIPVKLRVYTRPAIPGYNSPLALSAPGDTVSICLEPFVY